MAEAFPAIRKRYLVDFHQFRVVLDFTSDTSLTYTVVNDDGTAGQKETVEIRVQRVRERLFLVTWQESDKTTVVHVEDYAALTIVTNITNPDLSFQQLQGSMREIAPGSGWPALSTVKAAMASVATVSFKSDIVGLFRASDIQCMKANRPSVPLDDYAWMSTPANAQSVYGKLSSGDMPPDGAWPDSNIALFKAWMTGGYLP